jgi:hypothetical protein
MMMKRLTYKAGVIIDAVVVERVHDEGGQECGLRRQRRRQAAQGHRRGAPDSPAEHQHVRTPITRAHCNQDNFWNGWYELWRQLSVCKILETGGMFGPKCTESNIRPNHSVQFHALNRFVHVSAKNYLIMTFR